MEYQLDKALEILEQTPKTLQSFLSHLSNQWIYADEGKDTWHAFDIIGHLIHGEKTDWIPRLKIILFDKKNNHFQPFDRFAQMEVSKGKTLHQLLNEFLKLRQENVAYLKSLDLNETQLKQIGIHPELGPVTLKQLLACWVTHDLGHIAQIARVMAKQYKDQVGPWIAYIPILSK